MQFKELRKPALRMCWVPDRILPGCHLPCALAFVSYFTWCFILDPATWAFKNRLSGALCQRLSENPDKLCCVPWNCQTYISHLHSAWQFYLSWIFLSSSDLPLPPWPWYQSEKWRPCHFWYGTSSVMYVSCLEYRTSGDYLSLPQFGGELSSLGGEVGEESWRWGRHQDGSARPKFQGSTICIWTPHSHPAKTHSTPLPLPTHREGNRLHL